ncbi:DUF861 domain-containing protein [Actinospica sp. MGRD01-02]|uniref:DUF861 domain-containing protein n=1 Tax=Actinospica acidithermotolerans TaxID=2828514 RepID=A0A941IJC3_9ACTN|nr:cupin domain-containing protein [Actinospica acidithermotolerans]MBR7826993.1 DUF861 domain-containing protein [Actinospica acidithermotolerans]
MPSVKPASADVKFTPCAYVTAETLIEGDPQEREHTYFARDGFVIGAWEAQPYTEHIDAYPSDEFCTVLRGSVTLTADEGESHTFKAGESFTIEAGWAGTWRVHEPFLKLFAAASPN